MRQLLNYVDGAPRRASGNRIDVIDPATEEIVAHYRESTADDVDRAVATAAAAFGDRGWSETTPAELIRGRQRDTQIVANPTRNRGKPASATIAPSSPGSDALTAAAAVVAGARSMVMVTARIEI